MSLETHVCTVRLAATCDHPGCDAATSWRRPVLAEDAERLTPSFIAWAVRHDWVVGEVTLCPAHAHS